MMGSQSLRITKGADVMAYVCNYTARAFAVLCDGCQHMIRPGPNWVDDDVKGRLAEEADIKKRVADGTCEIVDSLDHVQWDRIAEPWRSGYMRAYGEVIMSESIAELARERLREWGESIQAMNVRPGVEKNDKAVAKATQKRKKSSA